VEDASLGRGGDRPPQDVRCILQVLRARRREQHPCQLGQQHGALVRLARPRQLLDHRPRPEDLKDAPDVLRRAIAAAPEGSILHAQLSAELEAMIKRPSDVPPPEPQPEAPPEPEPEDERESDPVLLVTPSAPPVPEPAPPPAPEPAAPAVPAQPGHELSEDDPRAWLEEAREARARGDEAGAERILIECLTTGLVEAGDELASMLEQSAARTADLVRVRRLQVDFQPGNRALLKALRSAALADHNPTFARAVDHVLRAFDPAAGPLPPPPLGCQVEHTGMLQLLARPTGDPLGDVVMHIWDAGAPLLARDLASYGITGTDRVSAGAPTTLSRLYEQAMRLLGTSTPLYARRPPERASRTSASLPAQGPPRGTVLLSQPLAALVTPFQTTLGAQTSFVRDPKIAIDEDYTRKIREYTTQPFFTSPPGRRPLQYAPRRRTTCSRINSRDRSTATG